MWFCARTLGRIPGVQGAGKATEVKPRPCSAPEGPLRLPGPTPTLVSGSMFAGRGETGTQIPRITTPVLLKGERTRVRG